MYLGSQELPWIASPNPTNAARAASEKPRRVIKRYSNRKLYDTKDSRYVTLLQIAEMVRTSEEVQIIDNNTKDDLTEVTLAQIIYEEQKQKASSRNVPLQTLKELIHQRTEKVLCDLREGPDRPPHSGQRQERAAGREARRRRRRAAATPSDNGAERDSRRQAEPGRSGEGDVRRLAAQDRRAREGRPADFLPVAAAPARGQAPERPDRRARSEARSRRPRRTSAARRRQTAASDAPSAIDRVRKLWRARSSE